MSDTEWPTHSEELARKVLDVISARTYQAAVEKSISERELRLITDSLYDTISGLVPWDVADVLAQVSKQVKL